MVPYHDCQGLLEIKGDYQRLCEIEKTTSDRVIVRDHTRDYETQKETIGDCQRLLETTKNHQGLKDTICDCQRPSQTMRDYI